MTFCSFFYYGVNTMGLHKIGQTKHIRQRKSRLSHIEGLTMVAIYKVREHDKHSASASKVIEALARYNLVKNGYETLATIISLQVMRMRKQSTKSSIQQSKKQAKSWGLTLLRCKISVMFFY